MQPREALDQQSATRSRVFFAGALMWIAAHMKPAARTQARISTGTAKGGIEEAQPGSALGAIYAFRRVMIDCGRYVAPLQGVARILRGLCNRYKKMWGADALVPQRRQPFSLAQLRGMAAALVAQQVAGWSPTLHLAFLTMLCCCLSTGVRLHELVAEECYKRANFVWLDRVTGLELPNTVETSRSRCNGDLLRGRSVESKCDPNNVVWGSRFMWFKYDDTNPLNFAWRWSQWEAEFPAPEADRHAWPAFSPTGDRARFGWAQATAFLVTLMTLVIGPAEALLHSFHAIRVTIATCLLAMKSPDGSQAVSDGSIQMFVRWKTAESMRIYARLAPEAYADSIDIATRTDAAPHRGAALPSIGPEEVIEQLEEAINLLSLDERRRRRSEEAPEGDPAVPAALPLRQDGLVKAHDPAEAAGKRGPGKKSMQPVPGQPPRKRGRPPKIRDGPRPVSQPPCNALPPDPGSAAKPGRPRKAPRSQASVISRAEELASPPRERRAEYDPSRKVGHPKRVAWQARRYEAGPAPPPRVARQMAETRDLIPPSV